jgi:ABC-type Fe3+/spermidine/putrescine transport system ATPase subunit
MLADRVALMFDGLLQQYDPPRAFYDRPRTARVAQFFRNDNFLAGVKRGHAVETALGSLTIGQAEAHPDGPVRLTVRPEEVQLAASGSDNCLNAVVQSSLYMGTYTQLHLDLAGASWRAHGPADLEVQPGQTLPIRLPAGRIWLLPKE